jgi:arsenite methyltransferase
MEQFSRTTFDFNSPELVSHLDELSLWSAPFGLRLLEKLVYRRNIDILDIGFGTGFPLTELAMRFGSSCRIYGIDPWKAALNRTRKKLEVYGINNVELIYGGAEKIPLPDNSIDLITSNNGINNVKDYALVMSECARVCRPGAQLIQSLNLQDSLIEFYSVMTMILQDMKLDKCLEMMHAHIYQKRKPLSEITEALEINDFTIESLVTDQFKYQFSDGDALFKHFFIRLAFMDAWRSFLPPEKADEIFKEIKASFDDQVQSGNSISLTIPFAVIDARKR